MIDKELLDILVCPVCKGKLEYDEEHNVLICQESRLKYPIVDGIPVMLPEQAERFCINSKALWWIRIIFPSMAGPSASMQ